jgi:hypothetical protein
MVDHVAETNELPFFNDQFRQKRWRPTLFIGLTAAFKAALPIE